MKPVKSLNSELSVSAALQHVAEQQQIAADLALKRAKLYAICVNYQNYLSKKSRDILSTSIGDDRKNKMESFKYKQIDRKFNEVDKLTNILNSSCEDEMSLRLFREQFNKSKPILAEHRDPSDIRFLKSVGTILGGILSLGLIFLAGRSAHGDLPVASRSGFNFTFWKSEGQRAGEQIENVLAEDNNPAMHGI